MKKILLLMFLFIAPSLAYGEGRTIILQSGGPNLTGLPSDLIPSSDNLFDLGSTTKRWAELHATIATLTSTTTGSLGVTESMVVQPAPDTATALQLKDQAGNVDAYWDSTTGVFHSTIFTATSTTTHTLGVTDLFVMQPTTDSVTAFQVMDTDGGTPIFQVDTTNERVGIGTATPATALDVNGAITTVSTATPGIVQKDSNGTDSDDNAIWYGNLTDTGSGAEDMDQYFRQQVAGTMTTWLFSNADGNLELGTSAQDTEIKGALVFTTTTVTAAGPTDDQDVSGVNVVFIDASGATVTIGGFVGGVSGQVIQVVRLGTTNDAVLEHNEGGGNQDILLADEGDQTISTYGGWTLACNGSDWFEVGY